MSEIKDYVVYPDSVQKYNTSQPPIKQKEGYRKAAYIASNLVLRCIRGGYKIEKINMEGLKPPYFLFCNHMQFVDFCLSFKATHPYKVNNIATLDGYVGMDKIMENLGCICTRKFTTDISLIRSCKKVLEEYGDILCMYPEARYTPIGTTSIIPDVVGKLVKKFKVPVVIMIHHGNYLNAPYWDFRNYRKTPFHSLMKQVLTVEQIEKLSIDEINEIIQKEFQYDDHRWQKENNIIIDKPTRAQGLHRMLYQCPHCKAESKMKSEGIYIWCEECGKKWEYTTLGELKALDGETEFSHVPDWYEWQRANVRQELLDGNYYFEDDVHIHSLPGVEYVDLGEGKLIHDMTGFTVRGHYNDNDFEIHRPAKGLYSVHVDYAFKKLGKVDVIDVSVKDDSFYCIPKKDNVITKMSLATEELFKILNEKKPADND